MQWHTTLSEVLYQARDKAIPALREGAFGEERQADSVAVAAALEIYVRLAAEGVATEQFAADVREAFPKLGSEGRISIVEAVTNAKWWTREDPTRLAIFDGIEAMPAYREARAAWTSEDE